MRREASRKQVQLPVLVERDEDGLYVVECPTFSGCYTQGETLDEALANLRDVIHLCLQEKDNQTRLKEYHPQELAFHTLMYA